MKNQLKTILLIGALSALVIGVGGMFAPEQLWLFVALSLLMNLGAYFFSDRMVLAMNHARPVSAAEAPELFRIVADLAARARIPMPRVYVIPDAPPNAFATGRNPSRGVVAVTEGILGLLTPRELRGVLAHELAHIKNRDILVSSIAAALASIVTFAAHLVGFIGFQGRSGDDHRPGPIGALLLMLVAPIAATLIQLGVSRSREYLADESGARLCGDPEALASALMKLEHGAHAIPATATANEATASLFIVNPLAGGGALLRMFSTHPSIEERVARLRRMARTSGSRVDHSRPVWT